MPHRKLWSAIGGKHFIYGSLFVVSLAVVVYAYWSLAPKSVLVINGTPEVTSIPGKPFVLEHVNFCKTHPATGRVQPRLVTSKTEILLPSYVENTKVGCQSVDIPVAIPPQATPDKYHISYTITYRMNPIRTDSFSFQTSEFTIGN